MRGRRTLLAAAAALTMIGASAVPVFAQTPVEIRFSYETPPGHIKSKTIELFEQLLEEKSGGYYDVVLYPAAQLVGPSEEVAATARGQIEMSAPYFSYLGSIEPLMNFYQAPLVFDSYEDLWTFLATDEAADLAARLERRGLQHLEYWFEAPSRLWTQEPVRSVADLEGQKIRVVPSEILQDAVTAMGATPTAIPGPELYLALQQGVADGAFTAPTYGLTFKFFEVSNAITNLDLFYGGYFLMVNKSWFDQQPEERQAQILEAAEEARAFNETEVKKDLAMVDDALAAEGMTVVQMTPELLAEFRQTLEPFYADLDAELRALIEFAQQ
ncbi:MAG: TRAP transporter substrate-binding protein [Pseudomonadota bacterium]